MIRSVFEWCKQVFQPGRGLKSLWRLLLVFVLGFVVCWLWLRGEAPPETTVANTLSQEDGADAVQMWTCAMHPQIQLNKPGKCPLCQMPLIPVKTGKGQMKGLRQLTVSPEARALMNIQVSPVERRHVKAVVRMVGKVDYDETRLKYITAWVPGRLDRLFVDYTGVEVKKGDHMVYIYSEDLYAAQQELIEALKSARARGGKKSFFDTGGINLLSSTREKLRLWGMTAEQIADIETRNKPSDHMTIYSPMGGIVIEKHRQEGDRVRTGDRIYTVADLTRVWVKMDAYESDLIWLRYGQQVAFTTEAYPGETFVGRIAFIDPVLNEKTRSVKVRVNVSNAAGKLKPEMFVRAVVRARVAVGGRVIDPDLAGKWIGPMHPEIVKDHPGTCDVCGMPLVRVESLGYVTPEQGDGTKPLVIPVSAALVTGTRAVVYVEDPMAKEPTFNGREIVLGARAGDYYLVKHGLQEGELVVTRGNFKIDSEIQIQAKPSMMTPEGGGGGGHHHGGHGGAKSKKKAGQSAAAMDLPVTVRQKLHRLGAAYKDVAAAVKAGKPAQIRATFAAFGKILDSVDGKLLTGHAKMLWNEYAMLLGNDVVEGRDVVRLGDAHRVFQSLAKTMRRVDGQFGLSRAPDAPQRLPVSSAFQSQLAGLWRTYIAIGDGLAGDNFKKAKRAAASLERTLGRVDMKLLADARAHNVWMKELSNLRSIQSDMATADDLNRLRGHFQSLSGEMQVLALTFGFGDNVLVYQLHCPMAFGKGAIWLQKDDQTRNPYFGSTMLECADRVEQIAGAKTKKRKQQNTSHPH